MLKKNHLISIEHGCTSRRRRVYVNIFMYERFYVYLFNPLQMNLTFFLSLSLPPWSLSHLVIHTFFTAPSFLLLSLSSYSLLRLLFLHHLHTLFLYNPISSLFLSIVPVSSPHPHLSNHFSLFFLYVSLFLDTCVSVLSPVSSQTLPKLYSPLQPHPNHLKFIVNYVHFNYSRHQFYFASFDLKSFSFFP